MHTLTLCMYTHTHTCMHTHNTHTYAHTHVRIHTHNTCMHAHNTHVRIHTHTTHARTHVRTHTYTHNTHMHTHNTHNTHTRMHARAHTHRAIVTEHKHVTWFHDIYCFVFAGRMLQFTDQFSSSSSDLHTQKHRVVTNLTILYNAHTVFLMPSSRGNKSLSGCRSKFAYPVAYRTCLSLYNSKLLCNSVYTTMNISFYIECKHKQWKWVMVPLIPLPVGSLESKQYLLLKLISEPGGLFHKIMLFKWSLEDTFSAWCPASFSSSLPSFCHPSFTVLH